MKKLLLTLIIEIADDKMLIFVEADDQINQITRKTNFTTGLYQRK